MKKLVPIVFLAVFLLPQAVLASSYEAYRSAMQEPYGLFKKSLSLTSKQENKDKALAVTAKFIEAWQALVSKYAADVPEPFVSNEHFAAQIARPVQVGRQALELLNNGEVNAAHAALEEIRYLLWEMRVIAGLVSLNDKINDFHEAMEIVLDGVEKDNVDIKHHGARYGAWLSIKWEEVAAAKDRGTDTEIFAKTIANGRKAIADLREAMLAGDKSNAKNKGKLVKEAYKAIFFMPECA